MKLRKPIRATVRFYMDKTNRETISLMLRVSIRGERKSYATGLVLRPIEWGDSRKRIKASARQATERNGYLSNLRCDIESIVEKCTTVDEAHEAVKTFIVA